MMDSLDHQAEESRVPFPHSPPPPPPNTAVTSPEAGPAIPRSGLNDETYFSVLKNLSHKDDDDDDDGDGDKQNKHAASSVHSRYAHSSESQNTGASTNNKEHDQPEGVTLPPPYLPGSVPSTSSTPFSSPVKSSGMDRSIFPSPAKSSNLEKQTTYQLQRSEEGTRLAELVREIGNTSEDVKKRVMMPCEDEDGEVEVVMSGALDSKHAKECAFGELCAAKVLFGMAKKDGDGDEKGEGNGRGEGEAKRG